MKKSIALMLMAAFFCIILSKKSFCQESSYVQGSGTNNFIPKWTGANTIGNSVIYQDNRNYIGIGTDFPVEKFQIGDIWTFHDGGTKVIGYNFNYEDNSAKRIIDGPVAMLRLGDRRYDGDIFRALINFSVAADGTAGSTVLSNQYTDAMTIEFNWNDAGNPVGFIGINNKYPKTLLDIQNGWGDWQRFTTNNGNGFWSIHNSMEQDRLVISHESAQGERTYCMNFYNNGNICIGTNIQRSLLTVNGKITCTEVQVTMYGWSDYVFNKDYNLLPLDKLENYIIENRHLPDVPSETEVLKEGLDVGEFNSLLLQKIEELTLYVIELNKQNNELNKKLINLQEQINE